MRIQGEEHPGSSRQGQQLPSYLGWLEAQRGYMMLPSHPQKDWEVGCQPVELVLSCTHCIREWPDPAPAV